MLMTALIPVMAFLPLGSLDLVNDVQHRAFQFFWNESNPNTGLTKDRAGNFKKDAYDVASIASTGFALAAYPVGVERHWVTKYDALQRTRTTLDTILNRLEGTHGWYYHFVNWGTGKRVWSCELSSIDTSILLAGVIVARQYWKDSQVTRDADKVLKRVDWVWMFRDVNGSQPHEFLSMGWRPENGWIHATWAGYSELLMLYVQAYGFSNVTTAGWDKITRSVFDYKGIRHIEGGPLFMHQMSNGFYDFSNRRDRLGFNYWVATRNETLVNRQYCIDNPKGFKAYGPTYWGLTACDTPDGYSGPGAPPRNGEDNGTIAPTCVLASMEYTPRESLAFLEGFRSAWPKAWGRYGFSNGVNATKDWVDPDVLGIDLGMMLVGIENYRTGLIHRLSMSNPSIRRGFERAGLKLKPGANKGPLKTAS